MISYSEENATSTWFSFLVDFNGEANEALRQGAEETSLKKIP